MEIKNCLSNCMLVWSGRVETNDDQSGDGSSENVTVPLYFQYAKTIRLVSPAKGPTLLSGSCLHCSLIF